MPSTLRIALQKFFCYATVFHAIELFSLGRAARELQAIDDAMAAIKVLGLNAKNARRFGNLIRTRGRKDRWNALIAGMCVESKLPLLTDQGRDFRSFPEIVVVPSVLVREDRSGVEILEVANGRGRDGRGERPKG
jgi:predicted nucleic acid-binding protein